MGTLTIAGNLYQLGDGMLIPEKERVCTKTLCVWGWGGEDGVRKKRKTGNVGVETRQKRMILELPRMIDHLGKEEILE